MDIVGKKYVYFFISLVVLIPGIISLTLYGLKPSIDFTGGSRMEIQSSRLRQDFGGQAKFNDILKSKGVAISSAQKSGEDIYIIRTKPLDQKKHQEILQELDKEFKNVKELSFETIGPTIGNEITQNAFKAIILAAFLIVLYIAWSFRSVPKPASSWRFGVCAIIALIHDILIVVGVFSILGQVYGVEVDSLFVTAILTIIGFSVHDTIVVFDRIRENLKRLPTSPFAFVVNESILQTFTRSLNTSLTVLLVLFTLLLFGGESTKWFIVALLVGILSGTYSSIFNASPLLVVWQEWTRNRIKNKN